MTFAIIAVVVALFIWNRIPAAVVALGTSLALYATGVLNATDALAGLGDPVIVFIASLFVISSGLEVSGVTTWAGQQLVRRAGASHRRLVIFLMLIAVLLAAAIGFVGAVAALLPVAVVAAMRVGMPMSQILMPLAFVAGSGGMLTLTASPVNILMSHALGEAGFKAFSFFEFALAGVPLVIGTAAIILLLGSRVLPHRNGAAIPADLSRHANTLVEQYRLDDGLHRLKIRTTSPYAGAARDGVDLSQYPGVRLVGVEAGADRRPLARPVLAAGDMLLVTGDTQTVARLVADAHLAFLEPDGGGATAALFNRKSGLAEVVIPPRSVLVGKTAFPGMSTDDGELVILAVQRAGADVGPGGTVLQAGDHMLLQGTWDALDKHLGDPQLLIVDSPEAVRRQALALGPGAPVAIAILVALVVLLASGVVPAVIACAACAGAMVVGGVLGIEQAYRGIDWNAVILVGGMIPLSTAMTQSGAAALLADQLVATVGGAGPYALFAGLFVLTATLGQLISNTATALIIAPIGIATALEMAVSPRAVVMAIAVAAASAFITPVATPSNLMVMGPGGYRFGDYWKLGLPLTLWFFAVAVFLVPLVWGLQP
jgi:di/tricarboxylate transporter